MESVSHRGGKKKRGHFSGPIGGEEGHEKKKKGPCVLTMKEKGG